MAQLSGAGVRVGTFALGQPSLDELFLALTGHATPTIDHAQEGA